MTIMGKKQIIKEIKKSWSDEDLNKYIDELIQEAMQDGREKTIKNVKEFIKILKESMRCYCSMASNEEAWNYFQDEIDILSEEKLMSITHQ